MNLKKMLMSGMAVCILMTSCSEDSDYVVEQSGLPEVVEVPAQGAKFVLTTDKKFKSVSAGAIDDNNVSHFGDSVVMKYNNFILSYNDVSRKSVYVDVPALKNGEKIMNQTLYFTFVSGKEPSHCLVTIRQYR